MYEKLLKSHTVYYLKWFARTYLDRLRSISSENKCITSGFVDTKPNIFSYFSLETEAALPDCISEIYDILLNPSFQSKCTSDANTLLT